MRIFAVPKAALSFTRASWFMKAVLILTVRFWRKQKRPTKPSWKNWSGTNTKTTFDRQAFLRDQRQCGIRPNLDGAHWILSFTKLASDFAPKEYVAGPPAGRSNQAVWCFCRFASSSEPDTCPNIARTTTQFFFSRLCSMIEKNKRVWC